MKMIKFFFESIIIFLCVKVLLVMGIITRSELKEFGIFCLVLVMLFLLSRLSTLLGDKLSPIKE